MMRCGTGRTSSWPTTPRPGIWPTSVSYTDGRTLTLNGGGTGLKYLLLRTDRYGDVLETVETDNVSTALQINILAVDLTPSALTAPSTIIVGQTVTVTWTVGNQGSGPANWTWSDLLYLSGDNVLDGNDTRINAYAMDAHSHLAPAGSYVYSVEVVLPASSALGAGYLIVAANGYAFNGYSWSDQLEGSTANNTRAVSVTVSAPDLAVTAASAPAVISWGEAITLNWTVTNQGAVSAPRAYWYDYVYLSVDSALDTTADNTYLTYAYHDNASALPAGGSYAAEITYTYNKTLTGDFFLLFVADDYNDQGETDETDNVRSIAVHINAGPDLTVSGATVPASGSSGGTVELSWTVMNGGVGPAGGTWTDRVYLSADNTWDSGDSGFFSQYNMRMDLGAGRKALLFNGYACRVETGLNLNETSSGPGATLEAWVYPLSISSDPRHVVSTSSGYSAYQWAIVQTGSTWHLYNGSADIDTGLAVEKGKWQHLAAVYAPGVGITFYKSGAASPFTTAAIDYAVDDQAVAIGNNPGYPYYYYDGLIDEVRVWQTVRSAAEIAGYRDTQLAGTETGLAGYWKLDDGSGTAAVDSSAGGHNGTLKGYRCLLCPGVDRRPPPPATPSPAR